MNIGVQRGNHEPVGRYCVRRRAPGVFLNAQDAPDAAQDAAQEIERSGRP